MSLAFTNSSGVVIALLIILSEANNNADCQRRSFQASDKKPYNYYRIVDDPAQVKPDKITRDNLFGWLNLKNNVKFKLWTRLNPHLAHEIKHDNPESLKSSNFDSRRVTKILIHGYADTANKIAVTYYLFHMRDAYLSMSDVNVIMVDYSLFSLPVFYWTSLPTVAAERLAEFLQFMVIEGNLQFNAVHLVGFSWGAHVAGLAGHILKGKVGRITGLDPAGPTFRYLENEDRLDKSDAKFVDIIHTNGGTQLLFGANLGLATPLGHVDIYPNGGEKQIGCPQTTPLVYETLECSHGRSARYFIESITSPLAFPLPCPCNDFQKFVRNECKCNEEDFMSFMGEHMSHSTRGIYQLLTKAHKPFGHGPFMNVSITNVVNSNKTEPKGNGETHRSQLHSTFKPNTLQEVNNLKIPQETSVISIIYKNVTYKTEHKNTFNARQYPNDDIIFACLEVFLKQDNQ